MSCAQDNNILKLSCQQDNTISIYIPSGKLKERILNVQHG